MRENGDALWFLLSSLFLRLPKVRESNCRAGMTLTCCETKGRSVHLGRNGQGPAGGVVQGRPDRSAGAGFHLAWRLQAWISFCVQWESNKVKIIGSECLLNLYYSRYLNFLVVWLWDTSHALLSRLTLFVFSKSLPCALFLQPASSIFLISLWLWTSSQLCFRRGWARAASRGRSCSASEGPAAAGPREELHAPLTCREPLSSPLFYKSSLCS